MPKDLLKTVFGHDHYRDGQSEIVNAIISGKDVLAIMPVSYTHLTLPTIYSV